VAEKKYHEFWDAKVLLGGAWGVGGGRDSIACVCFGSFYSEKSSASE
jgi:hypothetical protein